MSKLVEPLAAAYLSRDGYERFRRTEHDGLNAQMSPWDMQRREVLRHVVQNILVPKFIAEAKQELLKRAQVRGLSVHLASPGIVESVSPLGVRPFVRCRSAARQEAVALEFAGLLRRRAMVQPYVCPKALLPKLRWVPGTGLRDCVAVRPPHCCSPE